MNKKAQELAMHDKDTGSSEIQIALLTEKIETLSKHIKQFKKDKHSSVGLLRAVNRRLKEKIFPHCKIWVKYTFKIKHKLESIKSIDINPTGLIADTDYTNDILIFD